MMTPPPFYFRAFRLMMLPFIRQRHPSDACHNAAGSVTAAHGMRLRPELLPRCGLCPKAQFHAPLLVSVCKHQKLSCVSVLYSVDVT